MLPSAMLPLPIAVDAIASAGKVTGQHIPITSLVRNEVHHNVSLASGRRLGPRRLGHRGAVWEWTIASTCHDRVAYAVRRLETVPTQKVFVPY